MWDDPVLYDLENADDPAFDLAFWTALLSSLRPKRVLELASGTGRLTLPLARLGIAEEIVGLDSSPSFVAAARERLATPDPPPPTPHASSAAQPPSRVSFIEGDMRAPGVEGPFDLVAVPFNSLAYVHGLDDRAAVLRAAASLLTPETGRFAFDVLAPRYDLLTVALSSDPPPQVDVDHAAPKLGADRIVRTASDRYDAASQTLTSQNHYEIHWSDGRGVEHRDTTLAWHIAFPEQLEAELALAGLRPVERFGGWNSEPWSANARRILWVCAPA
jgi:SAM-dependent methyltransferase